MTEMTKKCQKTRITKYWVLKKFDRPNIFSNFDTVHDCDRRTEIFIFMFI